jgi:hypothetical protein
MKRQTFRIILVLSVFAILISIAFAQGPPKGEPVTLKGKIGHVERPGGYYVQSEKPSSRLWIVNQDPRVLAELEKGGQLLTIEGRLTIGADHLFIEKIDGKPYVKPYLDR